MPESFNKNSLEQYPDILSPQIIAKYLNISYSKALELSKSGSMPCLKVGNHYKIPKAGFIQWLNQPGYREYL